MHITTRPPDTRDWITMFGLAFVWGFSFLFIKRSVAIFTPMQALSWRMIMATLAYLPFAAVYWKKIDWKQWKYLIAVALCGSAVPNFMFAIAQQHVSSSLAGVLNALTPLFTLILGVLFFKAKITPGKLAGILLGFSGASILILFNAKGGISGNIWFALMCAVATVFYGLNSNIIGHKLRGMHPAAIASASFMLMGIPFIGMLLWSGGIPAALAHPRGMEGLGYLAFLGAVGTSIASVVYFDLLQRTSPLFAASVTFLLPVMSILIGAWDGEPIGMADMVGTAIILGGLNMARK